MSRKADQTLKELRGMHLEEEVIQDDKTPRGAEDLAEESSDGYIIPAMHRPGGLKDKTVTVLSTVWEDTEKSYSALWPIGNEMSFLGPTVEIYNAADTTGLYDVPRPLGAVPRRKPPLPPKPKGRKPLTLVDEGQSHVEARVVILPQAHIASLPRWETEVSLQEAESLMVGLDEAGNAVDRATGNCEVVESLMLKAVRGSPVFREYRRKWQEPYTCEGDGFAI